MEHDEDDREHLWKLREQVGQLVCGKEIVNKAAHWAHDQMMSWPNGCSYVRGDLSTMYESGYLRGWLASAAHYSDMTIENSRGE